MVRKEVTVRIDSGLETRPVAFLVQIASRFVSETYIELENRRVNAKSIMGMMTLGLDSGTDAVVTASGPDEEEAAEQIAGYLSKNN